MRRDDFAVLVLAAGRPSSSNLHYLGRSLVEHATRNALASGAVEVIVVAGDNANAIRDQLRHLRVRVVQNRKTESGISGSIQAGLSQLRSSPRAVVISLSDQPRITPTHLRRLARGVLEGTGQIVASAYDGVLGAPSAFGAEMIPTLLALQGDAGARHLIRSANSSLEVIQFGTANVEASPTKIPAQLEAKRRQLVAQRKVDTRAPRAPPQRPDFKLAI